MYQLTDSAGMPKAGVITGGRPPDGAETWERPAMEFSFTARETAGVVLLTVAGDVDLAVHARFEAAVEQAWPGSSDVVVDCSGVTFLDSMGLRVLVHAMRRAADNGRDFALAAPSEAVLRVLELAGLQSMFPIVGPVPDSEPEPDPAC